MQIVCPRRIIFGESRGPTEPRDEHRSAADKDRVKPEWREGDDRAEVDALERKAPYLTAADVDGKTVEASRVHSFPDYYLIDRAGNLRIADCRNDAVDEAVEALLAEPNPSDAAASAR